MRAHSRSSITRGVPAGLPLAPGHGERDGRADLAGRPPRRTWARSGRGGAARPRSTRRVAAPARCRSGLGDASRRTRRPCRLWRAVWRQASRRAERRRHPRRRSARAVVVSLAIGRLLEELLVARQQQEQEQGEPAEHVEQTERGARPSRGTRRGRVPTSRGRRRSTSRCAAGCRPCTSAAAPAKAMKRRAARRGRGTARSLANASTAASAEHDGLMLARKAVWSAGQHEDLVAVAALHPVDADDTLSSDVTTSASRWRHGSRSSDEADVHGAERQREPTDDVQPAAWLTHGHLRGRVGSRRRCGPGRGRSGASCSTCTGARARRRPRPSCTRRVNSTNDGRNSSDARARRGAGRGSRPARTPSSSSGPRKSSVAIGRQVDARCPR